MSSCVVAQQSAKSTFVPLSFLRMAVNSFFATVSILSLFLLSVPVCQAKSFDAEQVKSVFLYNLTKFVEWPADSRGEGGVFILGVLGRKPFGDHLEKVVDGETVGGEKITVVQYIYQESIAWEKIDLLFVSQGYIEGINTLIEQARKHKVLLVGDSHGFCEGGGGVNLLVQGRHIKIEVNLDEVRKSGLSISAQVLKLARIVRSTQAVTQ